jgi:HAD superfamily hydrolase (TIGR01509 family)
MGKNIIFDMDGVILDSMNEWTYLGRNYVLSKHKEPEQKLEEIIYSMTLDEAAAYIKKRYDLIETKDTIVKEVLALIQIKYETNIPLKGNILSLLQKEKEQHSRMCVLTTSSRECAIAAFTRLGIIQFFEEVFSGVDWNLGKQTKDIYLLACQKMNFEPKETFVYEDSLFAAKSAKDAGCKVIGVYDESSTANWQELCKLADEVIKGE